MYFYKKPSEVKKVVFCLAFFSRRKTCNATNLFLLSKQIEAFLRLIPSWGALFPNESSRVCDGRLV